MIARFFLAGALLLGVSSWILAGDPPPNDYVKLDVRPAQAAMCPGGNGEILLHFAPVDGIHVNADPPVDFSLDTTVTAIQLNGNPVMTSDESTGYLSAAMPVKQKIKLHSTAAPGPVTVKGTVTYFYCSDGEGWCKRQKDPVEFTILVKR